MRKVLLASCLTFALSAPAWADDFPVTGDLRATIPPGTYAPADHTHPQPNLSSIQGQIDALRARVEALEQIEVVIPEPEPAPAPTPSPEPAPEPVAGRCAQGQIALGLWLFNSDMNMTWPETEAWLGCTIEIKHKKIAFDNGFSQALADSRRESLLKDAANQPNARLAIILDLYPITRDEPRFCEIVGGTWDTELRAYAAQLIETGHEDAILRLWHEMDLGQRSWFQNECWINAWRRVHDQMMGVSGAAFVWQFNVNGGAWRAALETGWPGDAYVDDIGISCYDKAPASFGACEDRLVFARDFAIAHGKTLSWAEWGLWSTGNGDNPQFLDDSVAFFRSIPPGNRGYMLYFNHHDKVNLEQFPNAKARFRGLFGG